MIELTPEQEQFVDAQIAAGGFSDRSEVVQAGIDLLRKAAQKDYAETVREVTEVIPDLEAGRGRGIDEVDATIRNKLGFSDAS